MRYTEYFKWIPCVIVRIPGSTAKRSLVCYSWFNQIKLEWYPNASNIINNNNHVNIFNMLHIVSALSLFIELRLFSAHINVENSSSFCCSLMHGWMKLSPRIILSVCLFLFLSLSFPLSYKKKEHTFSKCFSYSFRLFFCYFTIVEMMALVMAVLYWIGTTST